LGQEGWLDSLTSNPGFLLSRVGAAVQDGFKSVLNRRRLRSVEFFVLMVLDEHAEGISQRELGELSGVDSGNLVEYLDRLEELRYASRTRDTTDRRRYVVTITKAGHAAMHEIVAATDEFVDELLQPLSDTERQRLTRLLVKIYAVTAEGRQDDT
jgi:DNA-binding MarR family transcriptional regulator